MARVLDQSFMRPSAPVKAMDSINALLFIGGFFTSVGGVARFNLACINTATRTLEPWNPLTGYSGPIEAIVCLNNVIYVGSSSPIVTGSGTRNFAAAFDLNGNLLPWNPNLNGPVKTMATDGAYLYLGGSFTQINGATPRNYAAKVELVNGTDQGWNPNPNSQVDTLTYRNGLIYAGGQFLQVNGGTSRPFAAAFDPTTAIATAWNPDVNAPVAAIEYDGVNVYIGGQFNQINGGTPRQYMAATDPATGADQGIQYMVLNSQYSGPILHMRYENGALIVGGFFKEFLGSNRVSFVSLTTPATVNPEIADFLSGILCSEEVGGSLFLGGFFSSYVPPNARSRYLAAAKFSSAGGQAIPFNNVDFDGPGGSAQPTSVLFHNGVIYVGGSFTSVTGNNGTFARQGLAAFDPSGNVLSWAPTLSAGAFTYAIVPDGNDLYIAGTFNTVNGQPRYGVAKVNTAGVLDAGWVLDLHHTFGPGDGFGYSLLVNGGSVYVGGAFQTANGTPRVSLVKADTITGAVDLAWDPGLGVTYLALASVFSLTTDGVNLYAAGIFDRAGGGATSPNGVISVPLGGAGADNMWPVYLLPLSSGSTIGFTILYYSGSIYIGGQFSQVQGLNGTFAISGLTKADLAGNIDTNLDWQNPNITTVDASAGSLFAAGNGSFWNNMIQALTLTSFQELSPANGFIDLVFQANPDNSVAAMDFNGAIVYFVGQFKYVGVVIPMTEPQGSWFFAALLAQPDPPISIPRAPEIDFLIRKAL